MWAYGLFLESYNFGVIQDPWPDVEEKSPEVGCILSVAGQDLGILRHVISGRTYITVAC